MPGNERKSLLATEKVPARVKLASFILKISTWGVIIASVAIVSLNMVELFTPISVLAFYGIVFGSALLVGLPLGIHEYRNTMEQANDLIDGKKEVTEELTKLLDNPDMYSFSTVVKKSQSEKIFSHFSSNQVFCASSAAIAGCLVTIGNEVKTYHYPTKELSTPTLMAIMVPGVVFTLLLAYFYKKSEMTVTTWENKIIDETDEVNRRIKSTLREYSIFQDENFNEVNKRYRKDLKNIVDSNNRGNVNPERHELLNMV